MSGDVLLTCQCHSPQLAQGRTEREREREMGRWGEAGEGGGEGGCTIVLRRAMSVESTGRAVGGGEVGSTGRAAGRGEVGSTVRKDIQTLATLHRNNYDDTAVCLLAIACCTNRYM